MNWSSRLPVVLVLLTATVGANPRLGWAQRVNYTRLAIAAPFQDPKSKTCKDAKILKGRVVSGTARLSDSLPAGSALLTAGFTTVGQVFDAWYLKNMVPSMTHVEKLGQLAETRAELLDDLSRLDPGPARAALTKTLLRYAWGFGGSKASSKFHPALRVNAILLLGEMNQSEESRSGDKRPPVPNAIGRRQLLIAWKSANQPASIRVAILVGLGRHVMLDRVQPANSKMSAEDRDSITTAMLTLMDTAQPQGDLNSDGLLWMRRMAMEILADLQLQGASQQEFTESLAKLLADGENSLSFRCSAAATLGTVTLPESHQPADTAQALAQLALDATAADLAELDRMIEELQGGGRGGRAMRGGGEGGGRGMMDGGEFEGGGRGYEGGDRGYEGGNRGYEGGGRGGIEDMFGAGDEMGGRRSRRRPQRTVKPVARVADERTVPTRRQLLHHLVCVRSGLMGDGDGNGGLVAAAGTDRSYIDSVSTELNELITAAKDITTDLEDFRLALNTGSEKLAELVGGAAEAAPVAEPAPRQSIAPEEAFGDLPDFDGFE